MEIPVMEFPEYVDELCKEFAPLFAQKRQMLQFKRMITGFAIADKHTIAHMTICVPYRSIKPEQICSELMMEG